MDSMDAWLWDGGVRTETRIRDGTREDLPAIREVVFAVGREYGFEPEPEGCDADLFEDAQAYFADGGMLRVLVDEMDAVHGMLGVVRIDPDTLELRKIYLSSTARGGGHGRALLDEAIAFAREIGCRRVVLETSSRLERAIQLYERAGFRPEPGDTRSCSCDVRLVLELES